MKSGWSFLLFVSFVALLVPSIHVAAAADFISVDEYICSPDTMEATKTLVLQFEGNTSFVDTREGQRALEDSFQTAYNSLSFSICDVPHFRSILNVSVSRSELVVGDVNVEGTTSLVTLEVVVDCRTEDILLFGSYALDNFTGPSNTTIQEGKALSSCLCPFNSAPNPQGLNLEGFLPLFNQELASKLDENVTALNFEELQQVSCGADVETFTSFVYLKIELEGNAIPPSTELDVLEQAFVSTYNRIAFGTCDPFFRSVTSAKVEIELKGGEYEGRQRRRLQDQLMDDITTSSAESNAPNIMGGNFTNTTALVLNATLNGTEGVEVRRTLGSVMFSVTGQWWVEPGVVGFL